jgi:cytochrome c-type biogenesis protein CcmH/NrfG
MALRRPFVIRLLGPLLAFAITMTIIVLLDRSSSPSSMGTTEPDFAAARRSTDALIGAVRAAIAADPRRADGYTRLGNAYLQKVRESADSSYYPKIEAAFKRALS